MAHLASPGQGSAQVCWGASSAETHATGQARRVEDTFSQDVRNIMFTAQAACSAAVGRGMLVVTAASKPRESLARRKCAFPARAAGLAVGRLGPSGPAACLPRAALLGHPRLASAQPGSAAPLPTASAPQCCRAQGHQAHEPPASQEVQRLGPAAQARGVRGAAGAATRVQRRQQVKKRPPRPAPSSLARLQAAVRGACVEPSVTQTTC